MRVQVTNGVYRAAAAASRISNGAGNARIRDVRIAEARHRPERVLPSRRKLDQYRVRGRTPPHNPQSKFRHA